MSDDQPHLTGHAPDPLEADKLPQAPERPATIYRRAMEAPLTQRTSQLVKDHWGKGIFGTVLLIVALWPQVKPVATDVADIVRSMRPAVQANSNGLARVWETVFTLATNQAVLNYRMEQLEARAHQ